MENKIISDYSEEKRYVCNLYAVTASGHTFLECYTLSYRNFENCRDVSEETGDNGIFATENWCIFNVNEFNPFTFNYANTLEEYLRNPEKDSVIKELVDKVGVTEKILRFFLSYESFISNGFGEPIAEKPWYRIVDDL